MLDAVYYAYVKIDISGIDMFVDLGTFYEYGWHIFRMVGDLDHDTDTWPNAFFIVRKRYEYKVDTSKAADDIAIAHSKLCVKAGMGFPIASIWIEERRYNA